MTANNDDIMRAIGRIEGKQDAVLERLTVVDTRLNNHAERLGRLERWRAYLVGIASIVSLTVAAVANHFRGGGAS